MKKIIKDEMEKIILQGYGCSTIVEHIPRNQEVKGSNPDRYKAFFLLLFPFFPTSFASGVSLISNCVL